MTRRNIACIPLNDIFQDFERDGLSMSWVHGNIGKIVRDSEIRVYGACRELHEIVNIHRLKSALENDGDINIDHLVGLLGSSLIENGIEDATKICNFLRGKLASYDNFEHFQVTYNFKELTIDVRLPYIIPSSFLDLSYPTNGNHAYCCGSSLEQKLRHLLGETHCIGCTILQSCMSIWLNFRLKLAVSRTCSRSCHQSMIWKSKSQSLHSTLKHKQLTWARLKTKVEGRAKRFGTISGSSFLAG